jgi:hypothetical protein
MRFLLALLGALQAFFQGQANRKVAAGTVMALAGVSVYLGSATIPSSAVTADLWVDTDGGTCTRSAGSAYSDAGACSSLQNAYNAANDGDTVRVKTGTYGAQSSIGGGADTVTFIGEDGATVDVGTDSPEYSGFNLSGNVIVDNVDVTGDYTIVQFSGDGSQWMNSRLDATEIRRCDSDEPLLIQDGDSGASYTITNNTVGPNVTIGTMRGSEDGSGGCVGDNFHLEMARIGQGVDGLVLDRVTFEACPNGSGYVGCGSGQIFFTKGGGSAYPRNITIRNSRFFNTVNYHMQASSALGTNNVNFDFEYNTFGASEPFSWDSAIQGVTFVGNAGTRPQTCSSGHTWTANVWQWASGTACGTDTRVTGDSFETDQLFNQTTLIPTGASPVVDAGETPGASDVCTGGLGSVDFTGATRPIGTDCDAGAYEVG